MQKWITVLVMAAALPVFALPAWAPPALAQRPAISADLSANDVAAAFDLAVSEACAPAIARGVSVAKVGARVSAATDPATFKQAGAAPGEKVFDVGGARGVVIIREVGGRCIVSAYGPPAGPTLAALARRLAGQRFERMSGAPTPMAFEETLMKTAGAKRVQVKLRGSDPGMQGHQSRFSVLTATVFAP